MMVSAPIVSHLKILFLHQEWLCTALTHPLSDPAISTIDAPVDANVWKIQVSEGDELSPNQTVAILEAMKLEIAVNTPEDLKKVKVEKLLVQQGETIRAGGRIALLRSL